MPDATRRSTGVVRTIQMIYGSDVDINYTWQPQTVYGKFKQFDFFVKGLQTQHIRGACH